MATSTIHDFLTVLRDQLKARAGLDGVQVATGPLGDETARESIQITDIEASQEWRSQGNRRREEIYTARGFIWVAQAGAGESVIVDVRERAFALMAEIEDQLRADPKVNETVLVSELTRYQLNQGFTPDLGRVARIDIDIDVRAHLPRG